MYSLIFYSGIMRHSPNRPYEVCTPFSSSVGIPRTKPRPLPRPMLPGLWRLPSPIGSFPQAYENRFIFNQVNPSHQSNPWYDYLVPGPGAD